MDFELFLEIEELNTEIDLEVEEGSGGGSDYPIYTGSYNITPRISNQNIPTKNKTLIDDVKIFGIPYAEVSNPYGGKTVTIGAD